MLWHQKDSKTVLDELNTSLKGLSSDEALKRLEKYGPNAIQEKKRRTLLQMFLSQFVDFMIVVLIVAAIISGIIGELTDTITILIIVILNGIIGFVQEYRAEKAIDALKKMALSTATVIRNGEIEKFPSYDIVPGDIVLLEAGNVVPADIRLLETSTLKIEEAALTGESIPVEKHVNVLADEKLPLGDRKNMIYKGTFETYGRGKGVVVATGMDTELGNIAKMLQDEKEVRTPLQKRLSLFGQKLAIAVLAICAAIFISGLIRGEPLLLMLLTSISLAVAAIPEALPAVVTICLALGAKKMVKQNALVRKLPAVETLGSVTYICSDKTGTLTLNKMHVEEIYCDEKVVTRKEIEGETNKLLMTALALSNDVESNLNGDILGEPTETALYNISKEKGFPKEDLLKHYPRKEEIPFDSDRKCMTTLHERMEKLEHESKYLSFTKGGVDIMIEKSDFLLTASGPKPLDKQEAYKISEKMAADGLRVLCIAMKDWETLPREITPTQLETNLTILGFVGMMDPPREEAKEAVSLCKTAGIKPVMITGDHPLTAKTIAKRLGIIEKDSDSVITGVELSNLSVEDLKERVEDLQVYARVAPEQKLKIIKALQEKGQFVAMTGDGVNDAPALKAADMGVAMGITGTDVSKEASDMILLDDNFATIVKAVKEGRRIFDNIRKFIKYTMTSNSGEIWTIVLGPFFGFPIPLFPIHILWINLVTDGLPGLALVAEPPEEGIMTRPPRAPKESIFANRLGIHIIWVGLLMGIVCLITQYWADSNDIENWQTMVFTVLCLSQMGHVLAIRSESDSLFKQGLFSNKYVLGALLLTFLLQMATIYIPILNPIFKTSPLSLNELFLVLGLSSVVFIAVEIEKFVIRKFLS